MIKKAHILVVDDDKKIASLVAKYLVKNDFLVSVANDTFEAKNLMKNFVFNSVLLDLLLPGQSGLEFLQELRNANNVPVLIMSALASTEDRITGLEIGADDYITKPFDPKELLLRLQNINKRLEKEPKYLQCGNIKIFFDPDIRVLKANKYISLTTMEKNLLKILISNRNQLLTREILAKQLGNEINERTIDVQIIRLRNKIEENSKKPVFLETVRGKGYVFSI